MLRSARNTYTVTGGNKLLVMHVLRRRRNKRGAEPGAPPPQQAPFETAGVACTGTGMASEAAQTYGTLSLPYFNMSAFMMPQPPTMNEIKMTIMMVPLHSPSAKKGESAHWGRGGSGCGQ